MLNELKEVLIERLPMICMGVPIVCFGIEWFEIDKRDYWRGMPYNCHGYTLTPPVIPQNEN